MSFLVIRVCRVSVLAAVALVATVSRSSAQTSSGPFAGLFGGGPARSGQTLDFRGSLFGLYQNVIIPSDQAQDLDPRFQRTSMLGGTSGSVNYGFTRRTGTDRNSATFSLNGAGNVSDYTVNPDQPTYGLNGATTFARSTPRVSFSTTATGLYWSTYLAQYQSGAGAAPGQVASTGDASAGLGTLAPLQSYYSAGPALPSYSANLQTAVTSRFSQRVTFTGSGAAWYSSNYGTFIPSLTASSGSSGSSGSDVLTSGLTTQPQVSYRTSAGITDTLTKTMTLSAQADWTQSRFLDSGSRAVTGLNDDAATTLSASVLFNHRLTRGIGYHVGYVRSQTSYSNAPSTTNETIDAGIDYNYGGSFTLGPRTSVFFSTSTSFVTVANRAGSHDTHLRLNGNAGIVRRIGRTWSASATYQRGVATQAGFTDPILTDTVNGSFGGQLARRATFSSGVSWARYQIGFTGDSYGGYSATSMLNVAVVRQVGVYAQYVYTGFDVQSGTATSAVVSNFSRQSASVGVNLWVPILSGRTRS